MSIFNRRKKNEERSFFPEDRVVSNLSIFSGQDNPTVAACINKISKTLSILPIDLYVHTKSGKKLAVGQDLFYLLEHPAYEETPILWYETLYRQILMSGNGYIHLARSNGKIVNLSLVDPRNVLVQRDESYRKYFIINGKQYSERDILHIPYNGAGYNGTIGVSPITLNRELIELDNNLLLYIRAYFNNSLGTRYAMEFGSSYPTKPADLDKLYAAIVPVLNKYVTGAANAGKMMIPPPDSKLSKIDQPSNVQAQLASLLQMVEKQICEAFNVPFEVIDSSASKYNSLEAKSQDFLMNCIQPFGDHICQSFEKLIDPVDRHYFVAFDYKHMLQTNIKDTIDYLRAEVQSGLLTVNEARSKLGMDSIGSEGDYFWLPANLIPVTEDNIQAILAKSKLALQEVKQNDVEKLDDHYQGGDQNT